LFLPKSDSLGGLRSQIDNVDEQVVSLLNKRARIVQKVGAIKKSQSFDLYAPGREKEVYDRLARINTGPFPNSALKHVFREIMAGSRTLEGNISIAYLGPAATFTHLACLQRFGSSTPTRPMNSIKAVFEAVEKETADFGIVPVENSIEGIVNHTLDLFLDSPLLIYGEILLEVSHALMSKSGKIKAIRRIYSHPHAVAQCARFLEARFPNIPVLEVGSTAMAAQKVASEPSSAAIASELAARLYRLKIIQNRIEDYSNNMTRFLIISKKVAKRTGRDKTSILFSIKDRSGGLHEILRPFADAGINLTRIESRPSKKRPWEYLFYIDLIGHQEEASLQTVLEQIKEKALFVKVFGSYPMAEASGENGKETDPLQGKRVKGK
jgi:chorismate mutase/prephenate dehydratase